uniref:Cro protein n=1 Tax=Enterobacteria phage L TaxID=45441 RepID=Q37947_9CAUD|nr:cro [Enterobacteria phage L]
MSNLRKIRETMKVSQAVLVKRLGVLREQLVITNQGDASGFENVPPARRGAQQFWRECSARRCVPT